MPNERNLFCAQDADDLYNGYRSLVTAREYFIRVGVISIIEKSTRLMDLVEEVMNEWKQETEGE